MASDGSADNRKSEAASRAIRLRRNKTDLHSCSLICLAVWLRRDWMVGDSLI